jgi:acetolactate synthase-1/2/3 large subunit
MGFALPAAIGAALLNEGPVVALTGDGGLLMCAGELATAAREQVHVVVVVFNDSALSLIDIKQKQRQLPRSGVFIGGIDWRRLAESVGIPAYAAATEGELAAALTRALQAPGPALVDARVDPSGYPAILRAVRG